MKTKEELKEIKEQYETLTKKFAELSEDELKEITGGIETPDWVITIDPDDPEQGIHEQNAGKYQPQYIIIP